MHDWLASEHRFGLLGPLTVVLGGRTRPVPAGRQHSLLAALLLQANSVVAAETLLQLVWPDGCPASARAGLNVCVMRLRRALGDQDATLVRTAPGGYCIAVPDTALDITCFRSLVAGAAAAGDLAAERDLLARSLALWRGDPLAGIPSPAVRREVARQLQEERLRALERRIDADLGLGRHLDLVVELRQIVTEHPYVERLWGRLMVALSRSGRPGEALAAYREVHKRLADDLGLTPGPELRVLADRLAGDRSPSAAAGSVVVTTRSDLPRLPVRLVGRDADAARIHDALAAGRSLVVLDGPAGVGKTVLAIAAAGRALDGRPDGAVFLDLRGHRAGRPPLDVATALQRLLRAVGTPDDAIPGDVAGRCARWRTELADRRLLVVLDDAHDEAQLRPLLPADRSGAGAVLVTSRRRLSDLEADLRVPVGPLSGPDAVVQLADLLGRRAGRRGDGPVDLAELVRFCGYLPLAVGIVGNRLQHRPAWTASDLLTRLRRNPRLLLGLPGTGGTLAASFDGSLQHLGPGERPVLDALAWSPPDDLDVVGVAAAAGVDRDAAQVALEALLRRNLVHRRPDRAEHYQLPRLLRDHLRRAGDQP